MKAIGYLKPGAPEVLEILDLPDPVPGDGDLLVEVRAVGLNPADPKIRSQLLLQGERPQVLGFDVAGVVREVGKAVEGFSPGDEVFYAGDVTRWGANAPLQTVDAKLVAKKPSSLDFVQAASLPLTALTTYEVLFDRLQVRRETPGRILLLGAAGGVGSTLIQAIKAETHLEVIATASRKESRKWVEELGADQVIDHSQALPPQLDAPVDYAVGINGVGAKVAELAEVLVPQGSFALVDDPSEFDIFAFKLKSIRICWEFMFTRSMFSTPDRGEQGAILRNVAARVDAGVFRSTLRTRLGPLTLDGLRQAHVNIMEGRSVGKGVFEMTGSPETWDPR